MQIVLDEAENIVKFNVIDSGVGIEANS